MAPGGRRWAIRTGRVQAAVFCGLVCGGIALGAATATADPRIPRAKIVFDHVVPSISVDDRPLTLSNVYVTSWPKQSRDLYGITEDLLGQCRQNGLHLYVVNLTEWKWRGVGRYDFSAVDRFCNDLLRIDPQAYLILAVPLGDPLGGDQMADARASHPGELVRTDDGRTRIHVYPQEPEVECFSLASPFWMQESEGALRSLIARVKQSAYGSRVIGYFPYAGTSSEWLYWGCEFGEYVDYSRPFCAAWRDWLTRTYTTVAAMNRAWGSSYNALADVPLPTREERDRANLAFLYDPAVSTRIIDFRRFFSELVADDIVRLARVVKQETGGRSLCGTFYGYMMYVLSRHWTEPGHFALGKVLSSPDVDFLMSPSRYDDRGMGGGSGFMTAEASVRLHGKLWITQADLRTHHADGDGFGRCYTPQESAAVMAREFACAATKQAGCQWFDFAFGWITRDAPLMRRAGQLRALEGRLQQEPPSPRFAAQRAAHSMAVIVDEESTYYSLQHASYHDLFVNQQYAALSRTGVGFDCYLLSDLPRLPPYKVYLFLNTLRISPAQADFINTNLKSEGRVLVWLGLCGITDGASLQTSRPSALTDIELTPRREERALKVRVARSDHPLCKHLTEPVTYGADTSLGLYFVPSKCTVLGVLANGEAALAAKTHARWTSLYSSAPALPASILRGVVELAGLKIANPEPTDVTYYNGDLLTVHTVRGGPRTFSVCGAKTEAEELLTGRKTKIVDGQFSATLAPVSTSIFRLRE
jgi:hypothetical protein